MPEPKSAPRFKLVSLSLYVHSDIIYFQCVTDASINDLKDLSLFLVSIFYLSLLAFSFSPVLVHSDINFQYLTEACRNHMKNLNLYFLFSLIRIKSDKSHESQSHFTFPNAMVPINLLINIQQEHISCNR